MRRTNKQKVVSIVLTWNSADFVTECIDSLLTSKFPTDILIVDNNSSDGTRELVSRRYPKLRLINTGENLGYAGGNNFGIKAVKDLNPDYIFIINPDAGIDSDCISKLVERLQNDDHVAGVSPLIYFHKSKDKLWFSGSSMKWRTGERIQLPTQNKGQFEADGYSDFLSGCAMMLRYKAIENVGLMDERYFLYCEETDWSLKFAAAGYSIGLQGNASAWHRASASTGGFYSPLYQYYINRNRLLLIQKYRTLLLPVVLFSSFYMNLFRLYYIIRHKGFKLGITCAKAILRAYYDFVFSRFGRQYPQK